MTYTEDELRVALAERVQSASPDVEQIVRRGRRIKQRRTVVGAVLAGAAVTAAALVVQAVRPEGEPGRERAAIAASVGLPTKMLTEAGDATLIKSATFEDMPGSLSITYRPSEQHPFSKVVCADESAWVISRMREGGGTVTRCGEGNSSTYNEESMTADQMKQQQRMDVWVLPADAPIADVGETPSGCKVVDENAGLCDGKYMVSALLRPGVVERLAAGLPSQKGRWEAGFYDTADAVQSAEPDPNVGVTAR